jgi:putative endonuclease
MPTPRDELGRRGEDEAARHLKTLGYRIVGRRERVLRGDIDIVALDGRTVVFVEVRSKSDTAHGHPAETVGAQKQKRIAELAAAAPSLDALTRAQVSHVRGVRAGIVGDVGTFLDHLEAAVAAFDQAGDVRNVALERSG